MNYSRSHQGEQQNRTSLPDSSRKFEAVGDADFIQVAVLAPPEPVPLELPAS
jgi:hypothetical protein